LENAPIFIRLNRARHFPVVVSGPPVYMSTLLVGSIWHVQDRIARLVTVRKEYYPN
uniref:Uncharacterized protein n=1 Tax=Echinostoma caproni TaxID=27848 RepID=A0A183AI62_9TREM